MTVRRAGFKSGGRLRGWLCGALSLLSSSVASAAPSAKTADHSRSLEDYFSDLVVGTQRHRLPNGLTVVLQPDRSASMVAVATSFAVGFNAVDGSGLPLVEWVDYLRRRQLPSPLQPDYTLCRSRGVQTVKDSGPEHTSFVQVLPAEELAFALWLEAARFGAPPSLAAPARAHALHARRGWALLEPDAYGWLKLRQLMHQPQHTEVTNDDALYASFFGVQHAVLTVVGDFDPDDAMQLLGRYLKPSAKQPEPASTRVQRSVPASPGPRRSNIATPRADFRGLFLGFEAKSAAAPNHAPLAIAAQLLAPALSFDQRSLDDEHEVDRFRAREQEPDQFRGLLDVGRNNGVVGFFARLSGRVSEATLKAKLLRKLRDLAKRPPREEAFEGAKRRVLARWLSQFVSVERRATTLARYQVLHGDARSATRFHQALLATTPEDVQRIAKETFDHEAAFELNVGPLEGVE